MAFFNWHCASLQMQLFSRVKNCEGTSNIPCPWFVIRSSSFLHLRREVYVEYGKAIYEFAKEIMAIISEVLGQPKDFLFKKIGDDRAAMKTAFNYYPQCPQPEFVLGLPPHADASALAILQQGSAGLEVLKNGFWIPVPPCSKRSLVVNVGDVIQVSLSTLWPYAFGLNSSWYYQLIGWSGFSILTQLYFDVLDDKQREI